METLAIVLTAFSLMVGAVGAFRIPILRQIHYFVKYQKNINKLMEEKTSLEATIKAVKSRISEPQRNTRQINPAVEDWIQRTDEKFKEMTTFDSEIKSKKKWFAYVYSFYAHSKKAKEMAKEGRNIIDQGSSFHTFDTPCTTLQVSQTTFTGDLMEFESTRKAMVDVLEALKSDTVFIVGVYGMGGSGKTSLEKLREKAETRSFLTVWLW